MNKVKQIKTCIQIWDSRLQRYESAMRAKREAFEESEKDYQKAMDEVHELKIKGDEDILLINEEIKSQAFTIAQVNKLINKESEIRNNIRIKKMEAAEKEKKIDLSRKVFEESKIDVSNAVKKVEKYTILSETI